MAFEISLPSEGLGLGNSLQELLCAPDITPGDDISYQTCKTVFMYHPLGFKMVCGPLQLAMAEGRDITVPDSPGERCTEAFKEQWREMTADGYVFQTMAMSRVYGLSSIALMIDGVEPGAQFDVWDLPDANITFHVYDPLNTSGSQVLSQNPLDMNFMKTGEITVQGKEFHKSRTVTVMNEFPVYIGWTSSAFGFVGRSVYQRAFFPLKSYVRTMVVDDLIETKVGVFVAKLKQAGPIANAVSKAAALFKREVVKEAKTQNVINITIDESVETLNLQNMDGPHTLARRNILENIATAADMPIKILAQEAFVEGFGEGTEDAKAVARYIDRVRTQMDPVMRFMDRICMHRAWTPAFYESMQNDFPQTYKGMNYKTAFYRWANSFSAAWPSTLKEPESELARLEDTKLKAVIAIIQVFEPILDNDNKLSLYQWATDNISENKTMFVSPLTFDFEALEAHMDEQQDQADENREQQQEALAQGGGGGGDGDLQPAVKMSKADALVERFDKAAKMLDSVAPEARDVIPLDQLRKTLSKRV